MNIFREDGEGAGDGDGDGDKFWVRALTIVWPAGNRRTWRAS